MLAVMAVITVMAEMAAMAAMVALAVMTVMAGMARGCDGCMIGEKMDTQITLQITTKLVANHCKSRCKSLILPTFMLKSMLLTQSTQLLPCKTTSSVTAHVDRFTWQVALPAM